MECDDYTIYYYDFLTDPGEVPDTVTGHLASCAFCRGRLEELKAQLEIDTSFPPSVGQMLALQAGLLDRWVSCRDCKPFLPLLLIETLRPRVDTPVLEHIEHCSACRKDVQAIRSLGLPSDRLLEAAAWLSGAADSLNQAKPETVSILQQIADRSDSPVRTRASFDPADEQTVTLKAEVRTAAGMPAVRTRIVGRSWARPVSAAAAVLLIATLLYFQATPAQGLSLKRLYHAVQQVHTACIKSYYPGSEFEPKEVWTAPSAARKEICISDPLGLILYKTDDQVMLVDQLDKIRYVRDNGTVNRVVSSDVNLVRKPWGLLPFSSLNQLPAGYQWQEAEDETLQADEGITVYDLTWSQGTVEKRWRGFLNSNGLPVRIEFWDQMPHRSATLMMVMEVTYPSLEQVKSIIQAEGFQYWDDQTSGQ